MAAHRAEENHVDSTGGKREVLPNQLLLNEPGLQALVNGQVWSDEDCDLPQLKLKQIRVFLCSDYEEFKLEREIFWSEILPEIQQHCFQYGVDILIFDPYQGTPLELSTDMYSRQPYTFHQHLKQIDFCRQQSEGVFFLCFLGEKYGQTTIPIFLEKHVFDSLVSTASESDKKLLSTWYKMDKNSTTQCFELQEYLHKKPMPETVVQNLSKLIGPAFSNKGVSNNGMSCMEKMIDRAFSVEGSTDACLFVVKNSEGAEITYHQNRLISEIKSLLDKPNLILIPQRDAVSHHAEYQGNYFRNFAQQMVNKFKQLVDRSFASGYDWTGLKNPLQMHTFLNSNPEMNQLFENILFHTDEIMKKRRLATADLSPKFTEFSSEIKSLCSKSLLSAQPPLVVCGDDGCGKTTLLAQCGALMAQWLQRPNAVLVTRLVGVCPSARFFHEIVRSVCQQICLCYDLCDLAKRYKTAYGNDKVARFFEQSCNEAAAKYSDRPLVILFDDVHNLRYANYASGRPNSLYPWIPCPLPKNVILICTASKTAVNNGKLPMKSSNYKQLQVPATSDCEMLALVKTKLLGKQRTITPEQEKFLKKGLGSQPTPLYAHFLTAECRQWSSWHSPANGQCLASNVVAHFDDKLQYFEKQFAPSIVPSEAIAAFCSFIECSQYGLTETELWELVGDSFFVQNGRSSKGDSEGIGGYGMPCYIWISLKNIFADLIKETFFDGKIIMMWTHPLISSVIRFRYLRGSSQLKVCHGSIADMYRCSDLTNGSQMDDSENKHETCAKLASKYFHPSTGQLIYDRRAAYNMWYHLFHAGSINDFEESSLCNFSYLESLLSVTDIAHLLSVFEETLTQLLDHNLHILYGTILKPSIGTLSHSSALFAAELIGRLNYGRSKNTKVLNSLLGQAMSWVDNESLHPLIVPLTCWIRPPLCPLVVTFKINDFVPGMQTLIQPTVNYQHLLVAGYSNGQILMYHILTSTVVKTFNGHTDRVICMQICNSGTHFVSSAADSTVRLWNLQQGTCLRCSEPSSEKILVLLVTADDRYLLTGGSDCNVKMSLLDTGQWEKTFVGHTGPISAMVLTHDDEYLVSGSFDFVVIVWLVAKGHLIYKLCGMMAPVTSLALTSTDTFLLAACADETVRVFSMCLARDLHELRGHQANISSLIVGSDDCQVFAGSADGSIYCYDLHNGHMMATQKCASSAVSSLKLTKDGHFLISSCADMIQVWNVARPPDSYRSELSQTITVCAISKDQKFLAIGNSVGVVLLWDLESCRFVWVSHYESTVRVTCLSFHPDDELIFSGSTDGLICIWTLSTGSLRRGVRVHGTLIKSINFLNSKNKVLSHDASGVVKIWRLNLLQDCDDDFKDLTEIMVGGDMLKICNEKDLIATPSSASKEIRIWKLYSDESAQVRAKLNHNDVITCLSLSIDGKFLLTGSKDNSLKFWEISTGYLTQVLVGHESEVLCCAMNDDHQTAASGSVDGCVFAWDMETGSALSVVNFQPGCEASSVAIFSDGQMLLAGYKNGWLHAATCEFGQEIASFNAYLPILEILNAREGNRISLRLEQCPRLAVVCLHNCPHFGDLCSHDPSSGSKRRKRSSRAMSMTSLGSEGAASLTSCASLSIQPRLQRSFSPLVTPAKTAVTAVPSLPAAPPGTPTAAATSAAALRPVHGPATANETTTAGAGAIALTRPNDGMSPTAPTGPLILAERRSMERRGSKVFAAIEQSRSSKGAKLLAADGDDRLNGSSVFLPPPLKSRHGQTGGSSSTHPNNQNMSKVCRIM